MFRFHMTECQSVPIFIRTKPTRENMFRGTNPKDVNLRKNKVRKFGTIQRRYRDRGSRASEWVSGIVSTGLDACSELARPPWRAFFMQRNMLAPPGLVQRRRYRSSPAVPIEAMRCNARMALVNPEMNVVIPVTFVPG
jgi:hypothetical protein